MKVKAGVIMVYTDGACSNNPWGPGGWAATLNYSDRYDVISGYELKSTNNRMELMAVVEAINHLKEKGFKRIIINSDSAYVVNAFNKEWIYGWKKCGWKTKAGSELSNADLWKRLYDLCDDRDMAIMFNKVKGHAGNTYNEIADIEAKKEVEHAKSILQKQHQEC